MEKASTLKFSTKKKSNMLAFSIYILKNLKTFLMGLLSHYIPRKKKSLKILRYEKFRKLAPFSFRPKIRKL